MNLREHIEHNNTRHSFVFPNGHQNSRQSGGNYSRPTENRLEHWCETCDRGFQTLRELSNHNLHHEKCNIDGCQFVAHPNVITRHIQMQHATGLYNKISRSNDPEEIEKWRQERKKKFPTKENIDRKLAELSEKIKRGEKMGLPNNKKTLNGDNRKFPLQNDKWPRKFQNQRKNYNNQEINKRNIVQKRDNNRHNRRDFNRAPKLNNLEDKSILTPFGGIQDLIMEIEETDEEHNSDNNFEIDDSEWTENSTAQSEQKEKTVCNALSHLLSNYDSDNISEPEEVPNKYPNAKDNVQHETIESGVNKNVTPVTDHNNASDDSGPEEVKIDKEVTCDVVKEISPKSDPRRSISSNRTHGLNIKSHQHKYVRPKVPSTLLQKLLHKEMTHERNITLQCIRYIIDNNYFSKDSVK